MCVIFFFLYVYLIFCATSLSFIRHVDWWTPLSGITSRITMEEQASVGNKVFIIISYVFMSPNNISYVRSCQDELVELPKTELCGQVIRLKHSFGIEQTAKTKSIIILRKKYRLRCSYSGGFFFIFSNTKKYFSFFFRPHCLWIKSFKNLNKINWVCWIINIALLVKLFYK